MSIGELFIELGVIGHPEEVEKFNKKIKETAKSMDLTVKSAIKTNSGIKDLENGFKAFIATVKALPILWVINQLANLTSGLTRTNQAMLDLTRTSDITLGTFQKWGSIGKMLGVDNAEQQLEGLNQRMFDLMLTGQGAEGFQFAGINPVGQDAEGVLEQLRDRVSGMSDTAASWLLQKMGLDPRMLHLLRMTRDDFEALGQTIEKYRLSDDQTKEIQRMNIQIQIASIKLKYLKDKAVLALMPAWTQFLHSLARVTEGLSIAVKWITEFIDKSPALQSALKGVAVAFAIIFATAHPLLALLGALYLIIDDVMAYFNGGRSLTGAFMYKLDDYIQELKDKFGDMSLFQAIPAATLEITELIIKASKLTLDHNPISSWLKQNQYDNLKNIDQSLLTPAQREHLQKVLEKMEASGKIDTKGGAAARLYDKYIQKNKPEGTTTGEAAPIDKSDVDGVITGAAAPIDYAVKVELPAWIKNMFTEIATMANNNGYEGAVPNFNPVSPAMLQSLAYNTSNTTNTDNRQIAMTNYIQTSQPVIDIQTQLTYARNAMASGWV